MQYVRKYGLGGGSGMGCGAADAAGLMLTTTTTAIETRSCMQTHAGIAANPNSNDDGQKMRVNK